jgi:hypothetical protein
MPEIFDSAEAAWNFLVQHGGLEATGRDAPLIEQLTERLARGAHFETEEDSPQFVLEDVLKKVSVEHLVNVLFGVLHPFVGMMRRPEEIEDRCVNRVADISVRPGRDQPPSCRVGGTVKTPDAERKPGPDHQRTGDDLNGDSSRPRAQDRVVVQVQPDDAGDVDTEGCQMAEK